MLLSAVKPHDNDARHASGLLGMMLMALHCIAIVHMCGALHSSFRVQSTYFVAL